MSDSRRFPFTNSSMMAASGEAVASMLLHIAGLAQSKGYTDGLKPSQWTALRYFAGAEREQRTVSAFAAHQGTTRGAASQMVEVLVGKELLARSATPEDRRIIRLEPTPKAVELLERDPLLFFARAIKALPSDDQSRLAVVLARLLREMRREP